MRRALAALGLAFAAASAVAQPAAESVLVRFELNDALVKGRVLPASPCASRGREPAAR